MFRLREMWHDKFERIKRKKEGSTEGSSLVHMHVLFSADGDAWLS